MNLNSNQMSLTLSYTEFNAEGAWQNKTERDQISFRNNTLKSLTKLLKDLEEYEPKAISLDVD